VPIIPPSFYYEGFHIKPDDLKPYQLFQYDMMFGKQYSLQQVKEPIVSPAFKLGFGKMVIDSVSPAEVAIGTAFQSEGNDSTFMLTGQNFVEKCVVYLNSKPLATRLQKDGSLKASVPKAVIEKAKEIKLEVKVLDSQGIIVSDSNITKIAVKN
jgi:hypothetical protein